jgi:hypothetical protein
MFGSGDVDVAESVEAASVFMEAADVNAGEYGIICDDTGLFYEPELSRWASSH